MTLSQVTPDFYPRIQPLFGKQIDHHLFCAGVLADKYPGWVIVDDPDHPRTALVNKNGTWCYLGGDVENEPFFQALRAELVERNFFSEKQWALLITVPDDGWYGRLNTLVPERPAIKFPRRLYQADAQHVNHLAQLPDGVTLHFIAEALPALVQDELPGDVQNVVTLRAQAEAPDQTAVGYAALSNQSCVAYAVIDCIVGDKGEIGLFTMPAFREQGLALTTSAATIAYGLKHGLKTVHWDCMASNLGSVRTAEKLGLQLTLAYNQYLIVFNQIAHMINQIRGHLIVDELAAAVQMYEQVLELDAKMAGGYGHFLAAAAWAGLGEQQKALACLHEAVAQGWNNVGETMHCPQFQVLQDDPAWQTIMSGIQANAIS